MRLLDRVLPVSCVLVVVVAAGFLATKSQAGSCGVSAIIPTSGPTAGGYEVMLTLSSPPAPVTGVVWNGQNVQIVESTALRVRLIAPAGAGSVTVTILYQGGFACVIENAFVYSPPVIQQVLPSVAMPRDFVRVQGMNFGPEPGVLFDGGAAEVVMESDSEVTFRVPFGATPGLHGVQVVAGASVSNTVLLEVVDLVDATSWIAPDRQTRGGDLLVIHGQGFENVLSVNIGDTPGTILEGSDTQLLVQTPPGQGTRPRFDLLTEHHSIRVTPNFSYDPPVIQGTSPVEPLANTPGVLTIYGRNFGQPGASSVVIDGVPATVLSQDHSFIEVMHGPLGAGPRTVVVLCDDQSSAVFPLDVAPGCAGDANGDGVVNFADLNAVLSAFGAACQAIVR